MPAFTSAFTIWVTLIVKSKFIPVLQWTFSWEQNHLVSAPAFQSKTPTRKSAAVVHTLRQKVSETNSVKKPLIKFLTHALKTLSAPPAGCTAPPPTSPAALHVLFPGPCRHMEARTPGEPSRVFPAASHWSTQFWSVTHWPTHQSTRGSVIGRGQRRVRWIRWALLEAADRLNPYYRQLPEIFTGNSRNAIVGWNMCTEP